MCFCYLVFNPKEPLVVKDIVFVYSHVFIVIIPFDFISSEYRLFFVRDIITEKKMPLSLLAQSQLLTKK